jgi:RNA polymerase primary sigma factor
MLKNTNNYYDGVNELYFKEVTNQKFLSKDEEIKLIKDYQNNGNEKSLHELVVRNQKYVIKMAKNYLNKSNLTLGELINEGCLGLMKAINKYDVNSDLRLLTYGTFWIKESITKSLHDNSRFVRLPISKIKKLSKESKNGNITEPILINSIEDYSEGSLDFWEETPDYDLNDSEVKKKIMDASFAVLDNRERYIIESSFGFKNDKKNTLGEIGEVLNLSKQRVRSIKIKALRKLRSELIGSEIL